MQFSRVEISAIANCNTVIMGVVADLAAIFGPGKATLEEGF